MMLQSMSSQYVAIAIVINVVICFLLSPILQPLPKLNGNNWQQEMTMTATVTRNNQSSKNQQPWQSTNNDREKPQEPLTTKPTSKANQQPNASEAQQGANTWSLTVFFHPILHPIDLVPYRNGKYLLAKWSMMIGLGPTVLEYLVLLGR